MKPLKLIFGILLLIGFAGSISLRADEGWTGDIGFGLAMARGNSDSSNVSFSFNANRDLTPVLHWKNNLYTIYSEKDGEKTTDTMGLSTKLEWNHTERTFSYYELQAQIGRASCRERV